MGSQSVGSRLTSCFRRLAAPRPVGPAPITRTSTFLGIRVRPLHSYNFLYIFRLVETRLTYLSRSSRRSSDVLMRCQCCEQTLSMIGISQFFGNGARRARSFSYEAMQVKTWSSNRKRCDGATVRCLCETLRSRLRRSTVVLRTTSKNSTGTISSLHKSVFVYRYPIRIKLELVLVQGWAISGLSQLVHQGYRNGLTMFKKLDERVEDVPKQMDCHLCIRTAKHCLLNLDRNYSHSR